MKALVCPTLSIDNIKLPNSLLKNVVGGSSIYAALASSIFSETILSSIVGKNFPKKYLKFLSKRGVDVSGVQYSQKPSFSWVARYSDDLSQVKTIKNEMNAFNDFDSGLIKKIAKDCSTAFISNIDPTLQLKILKALPSSTVKILDSMDLWMIEKRDELKKAIKLSDIFMVSEEEALYLVEGNPPVPELIEQIMRLGPKVVIYKRGEYGLTMYGKMGNLIVPSYPLTYALDPTGAGDALGGAIAGIIAKLGAFNKDNMATAVILASITASFTVEGYATESLERVNYEEIVNRTKIFLSQLPCQDNLNNLPLINIK